jgi:hypothetical protein
MHNLSCILHIIRPEMYAQVCDWVACLRPPVPPPETKLMITGWFGAPVPFNGIVTYVCARGTRFQADPTMEKLTYTCQVLYTGYDV